MTFTRILCPTDFSPGAQQALRVAVRMARETAAELVVAHAWYIPASAYAIEAPFSPEVVQQVVDDAQRGLDAAVQKAVAGGAPQVAGKMLSGVPATQIVDELASNAYDLCVIGTHGRSGIARVLLGSVTEKVVRLSPCSVLTVRPDGEARPFRHALVPTDFSDSAAYALDLAAKLVEPTGTVTVLHVLELAGVYGGETPIPDFGRGLDERAAAALQREVERIKHSATVTIRSSSRVGYAGMETLSSIDADRSIDLVVMGSHGRKGIKRALLGSVAEKTVRHAHCPVLVARQRG